MGAAEFCSESLLRTSFRQVRQEGLGRVNLEWGGATGWRLVQNNRQVYNLTGYGEDNNNHKSWARLV